jgi:hypothetical protein
LTSTSRPFALLAITKLRFQTIEESVLQNYTGPTSACQQGPEVEKSGPFTIPNTQKPVEKGDRPLSAAVGAACNQHGQSPFSTSF